MVLGEIALLTQNAFFVLPTLVQVKDDIATEEKEQKGDELDENETRTQRTAEVGGQLSCCTKLLFN
jgi:hypothetical protein